MPNTDTRVCFIPNHVWPVQVDVLDPSYVYILLLWSGVNGRGQSKILEEIQIIHAISFFFFYLYIF